MKEITHGLCISKIQVDDVEKLIPYLGGNIQVVRSECWEAVAFATLLAIRAFERGTNHARTLGGELLLRLAGTLQIKDAIELVGVKKGENYLVVFGSEEEAKEFLDGLGLKELPLTDCEREKLKTFFEKEALVEVL